MNRYCYGLKDYNGCKDVIISEPLITLMMLIV